MAYIGLAHMVVAKCQDAEREPMYNDGARFGRVIKVSIDPKYEDVSEYGDINDDEDAEVFAYADISIESGEIMEKAESVAFGHKNGPDGVVSGETDIGNYIGIGMRTREIIAGLEKHVAIWLYKVKLTEGSRENETKGDSVKYDTKSTKGKVIPCSNGQWRRKKSFTTAKEADKWLDDMAGIKEGE